MDSYNQLRWKNPLNCDLVPSIASPLKESFTEEAKVLHPYIEQNNSSQVHVKMNKNMNKPIHSEPNL